MFFTTNHVLTTITSMPRTILLIVDYNRTTIPADLRNTLVSLVWETYFILGCTACGILVPSPGIEPGLHQWKRRVLATGPPGNSQEIFILKCVFILRMVHDYTSLHYPCIMFPGFHVFHIIFTLQFWNVI